MIVDLLPFPNSIAVLVTITPITWAMAIGKLTDLPPEGIPTEPWRQTIFVSNPFPEEPETAVKWANTHKVELAHKIQAAMLEPFSWN